MPDAYSSLKAFRHPGILYSIGAGKPSRPAHVELILRDLCNQNCKFCAYRMEGYTSNQRFDERNTMPTLKALEIIEDCAKLGVKAVQFTGGGEPTIHPEFDRIITYTWTHGLKFSLVTNGVKISEERAKLLAHAAWVRVSLDAGCSETYIKTRRCAPEHWQQALESVNRLRRMRDELKTSCVIGVGFVVGPDNWREVVDAARLAQSLGADNFRISAQFSSQDEKLFAGFHAEAAQMCAFAESLSDSTFTVYNRFGARLDDLTAKRPTDKLCGYQFFTTYIGADLNVYRCCGYAYNDRGLVGSLKEQRFADFWMSQERFDKQMNFDGRGCDRCQFRQINSQLAYVLNPEAQLHEDFV